MPASSPRTDLIIALDAMGGDNAPWMVVKGADLARKHHPDVGFLMVGDEAAIAPLLKRRPRLSQVTQLQHAPDVIGNDVKPTAALRTGRKSSMRLAIDAVGAGNAHCVVSAGNTGALMAIAKMVLKTLPGIGRPAIASFFPTLRGESVMLDLGANMDVRSEHLVQFAIMGSLFGKAVLGLVHPTIGVLNVGSEELKGNEVLRDAAARLRALDRNRRCRGDRRLHRQCRAENGGGDRAPVRRVAAPYLPVVDPGATGVSACAVGVPEAAPPHRSPPVQRGDVSGS